jgi:predicted ribonuclease YlaK
MKKIIYVNTKETIELSYPNWLHFAMRFAWRWLKVKTIKITNGNKISFMVLDECNNLSKKDMQFIIDEMQTKTKKI